jgi:hypothetical protein
MVTSISNQHALCEAIITSIVRQCCLFCVDHNLESLAAWWKQTRLILLENVTCNDNDSIVSLQHLRVIVHFA